MMMNNTPLFNANQPYTAYTDKANHDKANHDKANYDKANHDKGNRQQETQVQLVATWEEAVAACAILKTCSLLALDMEGARLGKHGQTSLLQLATSDARVYIFDVLALGPALFAELAPILKDGAIIKLCYDCRCDADALFFLHGILPEGLYDLQIAYTMLFQACGDPFLKGLHKALAAPGVLGASRHKGVLEKKLRTKQMCDFGVIMMQRPLSSEILEYCASDVAHLFAMYALWSPGLQQRWGSEWIQAVTKQRMLQYVHRPDDIALCMSRLDFACPRAPCPRRPPLIAHQSTAIIKRPRRGLLLYSC